MVFSAEDRILVEICTNSNVEELESRFVHEFPDKVYRTPILDVADLKQRLIAAWSGLQQHVIDEAINQWRGRLRACVRADGRHFEHLL